MIANGTRRVLILEIDDPSCNARILLLKEAGYTVHLANNATEAFSLFDSGTTIDMALIATGLEDGPDKVDGIDVARIMQEEHNVAVLLISTTSSLELLPRLSLVDSYGIIDTHASDLSVLASVDIAFRRRKAEKEVKDACLRKLLAAIPDIISVNNPESIYAF